MVNASSSTDVLVIGAGPAGLFAVFALGMLGLRCAVMDALPHIGGQCAALYPEKPIYDIPACPVITGRDLIARLEAQAAPFNPAYLLGDTVVSLSGSAAEGFHAGTQGGRTVEARAVLVAGGAGSFGPNRLPLDNAAQFEGASLFYSLRDPSSLHGKKIVIAGGGDSAVDWAIHLAGKADVTVIHRRAAFRAAPESARQLSALVEQGALRLMVPYELSGLAGDGGQIRSVTLRHIDGGLVDQPADAVLAFFGLSHDLGPVLSWGLGIDRKHIAINPLTGETTIPGIYAAGDIATYDHKLKLILTGFAETEQAAHAIYRRLFPDKPLHHEYSTTKGIPGV